MPDNPGSPGSPEGPESPDDPGGPDASGGSASTGAPPPGPPRTEDGLRFAFGTLTVLPVRVPRWDRATARSGMSWAPLAGLVVGLCAAVPGGLLLFLGTGPLLAAVASAAVPAILTRGLHLDGLADTADGLGSAKGAEEALRVMKQSDIGPFGVLTLLFTVLAQVAVLSRLYDDSWASGALAAALSAVTARLALTLAAREGVPAARPEGLGAAVAGTVPLRRTLEVAAVVVVLAAGAGALSSELVAVQCAVAVATGCGAAELLLRHCRLRFGGVTGDVFGALAETAATACLAVLAFGNG